MARGPVQMHICIFDSSAQSVMQAPSVGERWSPNVGTLYQTQFQEDSAGMDEARGALVKTMGSKLPLVLSLEAEVKKRAGPVKHSRIASR
jgi:hypothetical protein